MEKLKGLGEIHEIMENIYQEEKDLTPERRIRKLKEESDRFLLERNLSLRRVRPKELEKVAVEMPAPADNTG